MAAAARSTGHALPVTRTHRRAAAQTFRKRKKHTLQNRTGGERTTFRFAVPKGTSLSSYSCFLRSRGGGGHAACLSWPSWQTQTLREEMRRVKGENVRVLLPRGGGCPTDEIRRTAGGAKSSPLARRLEPDMTRPRQRSERAGGSADSGRSGRLLVLLMLLRLGREGRFLAWRSFVFRFSSSSVAAFFRKEAEPPGMLRAGRTETNFAQSPRTVRGQETITWMAELEGGLRLSPGNDRFFGSIGEQNINR